MKKLLVFILILFGVTGCSNTNDNMKDIKIYTSVYPIEYITSYLYKENGEVFNIYPVGVDYREYKLTENQIENYSSSDLFIYNGLIKEENLKIEADYASKMLGYNNKLKIIDASKGMEYNYSLEEIWLNPSNMLMLANNVLSGLQEYITDPYLLNEIEENYTEFQIELSRLDAEFKELYENAENKTIVIGNDVFRFLEKYNFEVISLEENDELRSKTISDVKSKILNKEISNIYIRGDESINATIEELLNTTNVSVIELDSLSSISQVQNENKETYISIMNNNIELLKIELYK